MSDENASDNDLPDEGVLRPFGGLDAPDLPPVEPSKVVPAPPVSETPPPPPPPPVEPLPVEPPPVEMVDAGWSPDADTVVEEAPPESVEDPPAPAGPTVTLPRKVFLVGVGSLLAVLAVVVVLWQSGGDDGPPEVSAPTPGVENIEPIEVVEEVPVDNGADAALTEALADTQAELDAANAEVDALEGEVTTLLERPAPALPGDAMRRIIVSADAKFVDALDDSIAVVGAFGGVSLIDPDTNRVVAAGSVADAATRVMRTETSVWVTNYADNQILRLDPATNTVAASFSFVGPDGIEKDGDTLVVASYDGSLVARIDPGNGNLLQAVDVGGAPTAVLSHPDHGLWATIFDTGELVQIDRDAFEIVNRFVVGSGPVGLSADGTHLWVANNQEGTVAKIDPKNAEVLWSVSVGAGPSELVSVNGSVWVTVTDDGMLVQLNASDGSVITRTPLGGASAGGGPTGISYANGSLWVAMQGEQSVVRIEIG